MTDKNSLIQECSNDKLLEINGLKTSFLSSKGENVILHGIDFNLIHGEVLGIVGESGSGKSVTALSVLQLLNKNSSNIEGEILFKEENTKTDLLSISDEGMRKYRGKRISLIFQEPMSSLNPTMRCGHQVEEMLILHTSLNKIERKRRVLQLFEKTKLPVPERIFDAYPHELSGGQIQRVVISMAIAAEPDIIIADEPTTALDVKVEREILDLLMSIKQDLDTAIIFISHDLQLIRSYCDRILVMYKGEIIERGYTNDIFMSPSHAYTKGLIYCRPQENMDKKRLPTVQQYMNNEKKNVEPEDSYQLGEIIIEAKNLKKYYPLNKNWFGKITEYTKAVDDVSFVLRENEILGIVGESGSGKSTIGKIIGNLIEPDSGHVMFNGKDILDLRGASLKKYRRQCQIIFQDPYGSLNPRMKIGDALIEPLLSHKILDKSSAKDFVMELLLKTGLQEDHFTRYPHEFSGGQRQRVAIARALTLSPSVLICDECISALDVSVQANIINLLLDLREQEGLSILFIAHDLAAVRFISDNIMVISNGKIVDQGKANRDYAIV